MGSEIELKLLITTEQTTNIELFFQTLEQCQTIKPKWLANQYFDTPDLQLRRWDMGLRIRRAENFSEQTIKTAGTVVGGLHTRPEYNVEIETEIPVLQLFSENIWPSDCVMSHTQSQLVCIFETNFNRQTWIIDFQGSQIEAALDIGDITSELSGVSRTEPICELELELLSGDSGVLVALATQIARTIPVRLGKSSKAKRGYQLAGKSPVTHLSPLSFIPISQSCSSQQAIINFLETGLERWQLLEAMIKDCINDRQACAQLWFRLRSCIRLIKLSLSQIQPLTSVLSKTFSQLEKQLAFIDLARALLDVKQHQYEFTHFVEHGTLIEFVDKKLDDINFATELNALLALPIYGQIQLITLATLFDSHSNNNMLALPLLAANMQNQTWSKIIQHMPANTKMSVEEYQQLSPLLEEAILVGLSYGELYAQKPRDKFRAPWLDLARGIALLDGYQILKKYAHDLNLSTYDWLEDKQSTLITAMEHTRTKALKSKAYWT
ncbi:CYTH domain-containing protein [Parashewanella spongiae]|uniref:CYTH domain-containing protein n=1 Tax=Parashewanella spongiae TaxID=342950 RepID=A0A3A6TZ10_9GAMM|nr:CYTH and CHAD domain-containing protein [Parashewanella spongiae]MCL1077411.1 CYTH domain-containing protein [Parashewanella spongiae]RJY18372.1 CYTH domain-containing protein [Parashewanella spongiae]